MDRVFLDANVLFSAAYRSSSALVGLWNMERLQLVTSDYAATEALRNLTEPDQRKRLARLLAEVEVTVSHDVTSLQGIDLAEKDRPILAAAVSAGCSHLLTGDHRHFSHLYGGTVLGVLVQTPAQYISERAQVSI